MLALLILLQQYTYIQAIHNTQSHSILFQDFENNILDPYLKSHQPQIIMENCLTRDQSKHFTLFICDNLFFLTRKKDFINHSLNETIIPVHWEQTYKANNTFVDVQLSGTLITTLFQWLCEIKNTMDCSYLNYRVYTLEFHFVTKIQSDHYMKFSTNITIEQPTFIKLHSFQIDQFAHLVTVVATMEDNYMTINLILVVASVEFTKQANLVIHTQSCNLINIHQFLNINYKQVVLLVVCSTRIYVYQIKVTTQQLEIPYLVTRYELVNLQVDKCSDQIQTAQFIDDIMLLSFQQKSILYRIKPISYELEILWVVDQQQLMLTRCPQIENLRALIIERVQQNNTINIYSVYKQKNWYQSLSILFTQNMNLQYPRSTILFDNTVLLYMTNLPSSNFNAINLATLCVQGTKVEIVGSGNQLYYYGCQICTEYSNFSTQTYQSVINHHIINSVTCSNDCSLINKFLWISDGNDTSAQAFCRNTCRPADMKNTNIKYSNDFLIQQIHLIDSNLKPNLISDLTFIKNQQLATIELSRQFQEINRNTSVNNLGVDSCLKPCSLLYNNENNITRDLLQMVSIEGECLYTDLVSQFTNYCDQFTRCHFCGLNPWCQWNHNKCVSLNLSEINDQIDSMWYYRGVASCARPLVCENNLINLNGSSGILKMDNKTEYIRIKKGELCAWYIEIDENQKLSIELKVGEKFLQNKESIQVELTTCLKVDQPICHLQLQGEKLNNGMLQVFQLESQSFRIVLVFNEEVYINPSQFQLSYQLIYSTKQKFSDQDNQSDLIFWILLILIPFMIGCFYERKKIYLVFQQAFQLGDHIMLREEVPLSNERLDQRMMQMINEGIIGRYPYDELLMTYNQTQCSFCLEDYELEDIIIQFFCAHLYHQSCFEAWIRGLVSVEKCPVCNQTVSSFLENKQKFRPLTRLLHKIEDDES